MPRSIRSKSLISVEINITAVEPFAQHVIENPCILNTVFTERETAYCMNKRRIYEHLSARFAAKKATFKALGTGLSYRIQWTEVEVINDANGKPHICLYGEVAALAQKWGLIDLNVSLAHTVGVAVAYIVVVWNNVKMYRLNNPG
ncbi:MAG: holo-ACP synthase [Rhizonema sp. PD37]|nr:holo-ACP synthase [Rhizonema sp. PD37]